MPLQERSASLERTDDTKRQTHASMALHALVFCVSFLLAAQLCARPTSMDGVVVIIVKALGLLAWTAVLPS